MERTLSQQLADFLSPLSLTAVPAQVMNGAKLCILDTLGCMFAASRTEKGGVITGFVSGRSPDGPCKILGHARRTVAESAALANGTLAHMLELDDGHRPSDNHLGCVVVPAALATAEQERSSGAEFLLSVVTGYEVMGRVGEAVVLPRLGIAFHGTGTCGPFGGAASGATLLHLGPDQYANALGTAGTAAAGFVEVMVSGFDCKPLHAGRAAQNGVAAAYLARLGWEGPTAILEGHFGFCRGMTPQYDLAPITRDLGSKWVITDIGFKIHATCGITFTAVDAALQLVAENGVKPDDIKSAKVMIASRLLASPGIQVAKPETAGAARFSPIYAVARAIMDGEVTPRQLADEKLRDPAIHALIDRIQLVVDPEVDDIDMRTHDEPFFFPASAVEISMTDGRQLRRLITNPKGYDPRTAPLSGEDVARKFIVLSEGSIAKDRAEAIIEAVLGIEKMPSVTTLSKLLGS